ncbi:MAG: 5,6-dimethylbenzimidazole synthase, partial [Acidimicrobiia bacterium]
LEETPDLERHGWRQRRPLSEALHHERWTEKTGTTDNSPS